MGNITELSRGSLEGLKKQVCECIEHAQAQGYKEGYEKGQNDTDKDLEEIQNSTYDAAYSTAINDYNMVVQRLHESREDFLSFLTEVYPYNLEGDMTTGSILYDIIPKWNMREVIDEFKKRQEQKKQAEEESIKVGDVVKFNENCHNYDHVKSREYLVLHIFDNGLATLLYDNGDTGAVDISLVDKTGRHIDVTEQLLDKLKGDNNESNN